MGISAADSSTSYSNSAYSSNGISGMASGIDTDSLVESMLSNIQNKIDKQNQTKQQLEWKQEKYREVIDDINDFQSKYLNITSSSCIRLESFYQTASSTSNSSAVSVIAGNEAVTSDFNMQVAQLASSTSVTSSKVGSGEISTSTANAKSFKYDRTINIKIGDFETGDIDLTGATNEDVCNKINAALAGKGIVSMTASVSCTDENGKALKQKLFNQDGSEYTGNVKIETNTTYKDADGNILTKNDDGKYISADGTEYTGAVTSDTKATYKDENGNELNVKYYNSDDTEYTGTVKTSENVTQTMTFASTEEFEISGSSAGMAILGLSGTSVKGTAVKDEDGNEKPGEFSLKATGFNEKFTEVGKVNGSVDITLDGVKKSFSVAEGESMADLAKKVQEAFGSSVKFIPDDANNPTSWKISVDGTGRQFKISANADTLKAIGFEEGNTAISTQLMRTDTVEKLGIGDADDKDAKYTFNINGADIEYTAADTVSSIMNKVNSSSAGVTMSYDELSAKFKITSNSTGEGFNINLTGDDEGLFEKLGFNIDGSGSLDQSSVKAGKNAVVNINGVTVERANNTFTYNGLNITAKSTTGNYATDASGNFIENADGTIQTVGGEADSKATISTSRDTDKIVNNLKAFVEDYNKLIEKLNKYTHEKAYYKDYPPLTDAQKKEMSEKEIELWEEKSKQGLLRNDKDISTFLSDMRSALYSRTGSELGVLANIGINSSSQWSDYGKLSINEDTLRKAIETNSKAVADMFVGPNGVATKLNNICDDAAKTSSADPGSLVTQAGVEGRPSEKDNNINDQLESIADKIERLKLVYEARKERYWAQFNAMETALANMQSQSDTLASYLG